MKRIDLINNIEGSRLKKQFLEAFLLQGAYIEGLLKKLVENDLASSISIPLMIENFKRHGEDIDYLTDTKQVGYIKEKILGQTLYEHIEYLYKMSIIDKKLQNNLHAYRVRRNEVVHDLVSNIYKASFEGDIEDLVTLGLGVLDEPVLVSAAESVQRAEEISEVLQSRDQEKIEKYLSATSLNNPEKE